MIRVPTLLDDVVRNGGTVVVPSRQRAHAIRLGHSAAELAAGRRVWATPDVLPFEAWLTREVEAWASNGSGGIPRLLSPAEEWLLWRQCTAEATGELELVNRGALAETLRRASTLAREFNIDLNRFRDIPGTEPELLRTVQTAVRERYEALNAAPAAVLAERLSCIGDTRRVAFSGFLKPSPRLQAIITARREHGYDSVAWGAGAMAASSANAAGPVAGAVAIPRIVTAGDELEELERIADWCHRQVAGRPDARLLVMLPGSPGARERLASLIQQALDPAGWLADPSSRSHSLVVIEGGTPLARCPSIAHALTTLAWLGGHRADFEALSEWLRAPYWTAPDAAVRVRLELWLRERGRMSFDLRELGRALSSQAGRHTEDGRGSSGSAGLEIARRIEEAQAALNHNSGSPREWSERFRSALNAFGWPGSRARSSGEQQTVVRFHELLDEFGQLALAARSMSRDSAIQWFTELASRTAFRPADDDAVVTISPMLVDPVAQYDAVWVAGLHADVFPQPVQPDAFVPLTAQIAAGVPASSAAGRLEEARALVDAWRAAAAGELVLSSPARREDLELLPSPLLAHWEPTPAATRARGGPTKAGRSRRGERAAAQDVDTTAHKAESAALDPVAGRSGIASGCAGTGRGLWLPMRLHREGLLETLDDPVGVPWSTSRPLPSGTRSLELQNQCPFRAYSELRLGSGELDLPEPGVAPDVRGQLLHAALQRLWAKLGDSRALLAQSDSALALLIDQCVAEAADMTLGLRSAAAGHAHSEEPPPAFARECRRAARLIRRLCNLERERAPFRVDATELEATLNLGGAGLRMRIDRLDVLESGGRAILDYKSGRRSAADWYGERPSHPQLLAYLAAVGEDVLAMATVNVTAREVRFDGVASSAELLPKVKGVEGPEGQTSEDAWQFRQREWRACIERLAQDFVAGRAVVDPKPGACDFCHAVSVCRISDRRSTAETEVAGDANGASGEARDE